MRPPGAEGRPAASAASAEIAAGRCREGGGGHLDLGGGAEVDAGKRGRAGGGTGEGRGEEIGGVKKWRVRETS